MSHNLSHANHGAPGLVKENTSCCGTLPLARIHSPVRMCHPVSPSPSIDVAPCIFVNRKTSGNKNATSVSDGIRRNSGLVRVEAMLFDQHRHVTNQLVRGRGELDIVRAATASVALSRVSGSIA